LKIRKHETVGPTNWRAREEGEDMHPFSTSSVMVVCVLTGTFACAGGFTLFTTQTWVDGV
jgi:hypothetical protein